MRFFILNIIAFIIAASSLDVNVRSEASYQNEGTDTFSSMPILDIQPLRNPAKKFEVEITTYDLAESAIFAANPKLKTSSFRYYLPIYSLNRAKEYFLLI